MDVYSREYVLIGHHGALLRIEYRLVIKAAVLAEALGFDCDIPTNSMGGSIFGKTVVLIQDIL